VDDTLAQSDLALAAELQRALLPGRPPTDVPHQQAAARNRMCGTVGGDFCDFIPLHDDQIALLIGDVVGHGVRAALLMAQIAGYLRSRQAEHSRPAAVIRGLNRLLIDLGQRTDGVLPCTLFYAVLDAPTGLLLFVNAGHPGPFLCSRKTCLGALAGAQNMLLGVEPFEPEEGCHSFQPGERLVLYTDGIVEAADAKGELFGQARLHEALSAQADASPDGCADVMLRAVDAFRGPAPRTDDETLVVIDRV